MGPYSEQKQIERAASIQRLLETTPNLSERTRCMWQKHLKDLAVSEEEYNARVKAIYSGMTRNAFYAS